MFIQSFQHAVAFENSLKQFAQNSRNLNLSQPNNFTPAQQVGLDLSENNS
jgi:hypothetical protein